jgi:hypothetical protein
MTGGPIVAVGTTAKLMDTEYAPVLRDRESIPVRGTTASKSVVFTNGRPVQHMRASGRMGRDTALESNIGANGSIRGSGLRVIKAGMESEPAYYQMQDMKVPGQMDYKMDMALKHTLMAEHIKVIS